MTTTVTSRPIGVATTSAIFIGRSLRQSLRDVESLLMAILLPVTLMLLFTFIFGGAIDPTGRYVDYVVPGTILVCAGFGASSTAVLVSRDMTGGMMDRLRTMRLSRIGIVTGHVVASVSRNLVATAIVIAVAIGIGFRPQATFLEWIAATGVIVAYLLAITYLFAAVGMAAGSPEAANGYGFLLLFLPYLSSAFVPIATLPSWLQPVARNQPLTPVVETLRDLLVHQPSATSWVVAVVWSLGIGVFGAGMGAWLYRRKAGRR